MNIGRAEKITGVSKKTIRYYEKVGLFIVDRKSNGYRSFDDADIHKLMFIKNMRNLGFSLKECDSLLAIYENKHFGTKLKTLANLKLGEIECKINELLQIQKSLRHFIKSCDDNNFPNNSIIAELADKNQRRDY